MVDREEAYDKIKQDDNLLVIALDDLRDRTRMMIKEDLEKSKSNMMNMHSVPTESSGKQIMDMVQQREVSIEKIEEFDEK